MVVVVVVVTRRSSLRRDDSYLHPSEVEMNLSMQTHRPDFKISPFAASHALFGQFLTLSQQEYPPLPENLQIGVSRGQGASMPAALKVLK